MPVVYQELRWLAHRYMDRDLFRWRAGSLLEWEWPAAEKKMGRDMALVSPGRAGQGIQAPPSGPNGLLKADVPNASRDHSGNFVR
jgi:hypothetical protein